VEAKEYDWETSYRRRIEELNAQNRRAAGMAQAPALIMNPDGRVHMEGLRPGQRAYYDHNGVRHLFCG
jgi:hypothetical protein